MEYGNENQEAQRALFESIVSFSDDAILSITLDGIITSWNKGAENLYGYLSEEIIGKHISIIIPRDRMVEEQMIIEKIKQGQHVQHYETKRIRKDASLAPVSLTISPLKNESGKITGASKIARDITKRIQAEELQHSTEQRYRNVVENILDGLMIDDVDGKVVYANDQFLNLYGLSREDLSNLALEDYVAPEYRAQLRDRHNRRVAGEAVPDIFEYEGLHKDGTRRWLEVRVCKIAENGEIKGTQSAIRDITERKRAEENLKKSEKIYRIIAACLPGATISVIDKFHRYILAEGEGLKNLGYSKEMLENNLESEGLATAEYKLASDRQRAFDGETVSVELKIKDYYYRVQYIPLRDEKDEVYAVMTISLDITDIKKAAEEITQMNELLEHKVADRTKQLETANKELEAFSYSVSHDLRAPLRIINGYADILEKENNDKLDNEGKRVLGIIRNNTHKMGRLIDELLNLAQFTRKELALQHTDMDQLVNNVIEEQITHTKKRIEFRKEQLIPVQCDHALMRQVWTNLISNAIKYSGTRDIQFIEISSERKDNKVIYSVKDNGVGFDMLYSNKLFGVFQRLHKKTEFEGTGVGLALVQRIMQKHGGEVWAHGEVDKGATFYFSLTV